MNFNLIIINDKLVKSLIVLSVAGGEGSVVEARLSICFLCRHLEPMKIMLIGMLEILQMNLNCVIDKHFCFYKTKNHDHKPKVNDSWVKV